MNSCNTRTLPLKAQHHDKRVKKGQKPTDQTLELHWGCEKVRGFILCWHPTLHLFVLLDLWLLEARSNNSYFTSAKMPLLSACMPVPRALVSQKKQPVALGRNREAAAVCFLGLHTLRPQQCVECPFWHSTEHLHLPLSLWVQALMLFQQQLSEIKWEADSPNTQLMFLPC